MLSKPWTVRQHRAQELCMTEAKIISSRSLNFVVICWICCWYVVCLRSAHMVYESLCVYDCPGMGSESIETCQTIFLITNDSNSLEVHYVDSTFGFVPRTIGVGFDSRSSWWGHICWSFSCASRSVSEMSQTGPWDTMGYHGIPWDTMASWNLLLSTYDRLCFSRSKLLDIGYWLGTAKFDGLKSLEHFRYFRTSFAHSLTAINWVQNPRFWFETSLLRAAPRKVQTKAADFTKILLQPCRLWHVLQWLKHVKTNERFRTENWESTINPPISIDQDRWDRRYRWGAAGVVCLRCISMATVVFV